MTDWSPPRSIVSLSACAGECGAPLCPAVVVGCDCATTTHLTVDIPAAGGSEVAYTCEGCQSSHWLTITAAT